MKTKQKAIRRIPSPTAVPPMDMDLSPDVEYMECMPSSLKRKQSFSDSFGPYASPENTPRKMYRQHGHLSYQNTCQKALTATHKNTITHDSGSSSTVTSTGQHGVSNLYHRELYETHALDSVTIRPNGSNCDTQGSTVNGNKQRRFLRTSVPAQMQSHTTMTNSNIADNSQRQRKRPSCTEVCKHCNAFFWYDERIKRSKRNCPEYHRCCNNGKVALERTQDCPHYIKELFQDKHFMDNIRAYNQMFAMTSLGVELDDSINRGRGPNLYIYDTSNEVKNRLDHFNKSESRLRRDIVENLIQVLDNHNELVKLFRTAHDKMEGVDVPNFKLKLFGVVGSKQYDLPAGDSIGAIVFEGGPDVGTNYDVIIEKRGGKPQRIDKLKPHYMSLHFPLLFIHGEEGYHLGLKLRQKEDESSEKEKQMSMKMYYAYEIHDRLQDNRLMAGTPEPSSPPKDLGKQIITQEEVTVAQHGTLQKADGKEIVAQPQSTSLMSLKGTDFHKSLYVKVYRKWTTINKSSVLVMHHCILLDQQHNINTL
ncbi:helitron helicase-like domain-containing protein [Artemisia annua]|uniref:Helitron helicase-like domain-containing protein n=1 Tax=Artemisia annua TaxID=35608 RepID=A0A2U1NGU7_ARTAN|nr:helitron helicase-like domain-containing protein [Artemisia annua]